MLLAVMPERRGGGDLDEHAVIGRWAGDRVVFVGDYSEDSDFKTKKGEPKFGELYSAVDGFTDITDQVIEVIERELEGKFVSPPGGGWGRWVEKGEIPAAVGEKLTGEREPA